VALGVIEGAAEATAALLKVASGRLTDRFRRRKPLVVAGYALSGAVRPLVGFAAGATLVLGVRVLDRIGKGLRSSPRDALIADVVADDRRGRAFGLHRAMDNAGAVLGPAVAALLLGSGLGLRELFWSAALPGVVVLGVLVIGVREPPRGAAHTAHDPQARPAELGRGYWKLVGVIGLFTLSAASDAFLLLRLGELGLGPAAVAWAWAAHNVMKTLAVYAGGGIADRVDRKKLLAVGWVLHALAFAAFALVSTPAAAVGVLIGYAVRFGAVEPTERALVAELAPASLRGSAFGGFHATVGICSIPASALFGVLWTLAGARWAFAASAAIALLAVLGLLTLAGPGRVSSGRERTGPAARTGVTPP
jgi:MFS family permease